MRLMARVDQGGADAVFLAQISPGPQFERVGLVSCQEHRGPAAHNKMEENVWKKSPGGSPKFRINQNSCAHFSCAICHLYWRLLSKVYKLRRWRTGFRHFNGGQAGRRTSARRMHGTHSRALRQSAKCPDFPYSGNSKKWKR